MYKRMTLTQFLNDNGTCLARVLRLNFTVGYLRTHVREDSEFAGKLDLGYYWIEEIFRMGSDENPYWRITLHKDIGGAGHHTASKTTDEEIYCSHGGMNQIFVEVQCLGDT